jgi:hypothetical protein
MRRYNPETHMQPVDEGEWVRADAVERMENLVKEMIEAENKLGGIQTENGVWFEAYQKLKNLAKA